MAQYIATRPIVDLYMAANMMPVPRVAMQWWEQEVLDLEGVHTAAQEAKRVEGGEEETDWMETAKDD